MSSILFITGQIAQQLTDSEISKLNSVLSKVETEFLVDSVLVTGHTDNEGRKIYNQSLSERRAWNVAEFLRKSIQEKTVIIKTLSFGELQPISKEFKENRRVEITFYLSEKPIIVLEERKEAIDSAKKESDLIRKHYVTLLNDMAVIANHQDTTIIHVNESMDLEILPNTFDKDSILVQFDSYFSPKEIINANLSTRSTDGLLVSGGMFRVTFSEIPKKPTKLTIPCGSPCDKMQMYIQNNEGIWELDSGARILRDEKGFCYILMSSGRKIAFYNCDEKPRKFSIKIKRKYRKQDNEVYCYVPKTGTMSSYLEHKKRNKYILGIWNIPNTLRSVTLVFLTRYNGEIITAERIVALPISQKNSKKRGTKIKSIFRRSDRKSIIDTDFLDKPMYLSTKLN